jgi:hypothetical protein
LNGHLTEPSVGFWEAFDKFEADSVGRRGELLGLLASTIVTARPPAPSLMLIQFDAR